ncbi:MAG: hypothetical protein AB8G77_13950 [Rhodothermales bacterium]
MAKKEEPVTNQPAEKTTPQDSTSKESTSQDSASQESTTEQSEGDMLNELRDAYEQARVDLKQTTEKLRSELNKVDLEEAGQAAKTWVKDNPGLAFFMAVGAGMLVGRALTKAMEPAPPPSISERARRRSSALADSARHFAGEAVDNLSTHAALAGEHMADRARSARGSVYDKAGSLSELINQRAGDLGATASGKTGELISSFSDAAERAADSLQVAALDLSKSIKKNKTSPQSLYDSLMNSAKTVFGAMVFKRVSDWIRERY